MKKLLMAFLLISLIILPTLTLAQTSSSNSISEQIAVLMRQISELQAKIEVLKGMQTDPTMPIRPTPGWCYKFDYNIRPATAATTDAAALKTAFAQEGFTSADLNSATIAFQEKYKAEILAPYGLSRGTGYVGVATRAKLNALYGCKRPIVTGNEPVILEVSGPSQLLAGQTGTWTIKAKDSSGGTLTYAVDWGDESLYLPLMNSATMARPIAYSQEATFTHLYEAGVGTYTVTFTVKNQSGNVAKSSLTVSVYPFDQVLEHSISLISPNGGETWLINSQPDCAYGAPCAMPENRVTVGYTASGVPSGAYLGVYLVGGPTNGRVSLLPYPQYMTLQYPSSFSFALSQQVLVGGDAVAQLQPGQYKVRLVLWDKQPCEGRCITTELHGNVIAEDTSDGYITVTR